MAEHPGDTTSVKPLTPPPAAAPAQGDFVLDLGKLTPKPSPLPGSASEGQKDGEFALPKGASELFYNSQSGRLTFKPAEAANSEAVSSASSRRRPSHPKLATVSKEPSTPALAPAAAPSTRRVRAETAGRARRASTGSAVSSSQSPGVLAMVVGGAVLVLIGGVLLFSGGSSEAPARHEEKVAKAAPPEALVRAVEPPKAAPKPAPEPAPEPARPTLVEEEPKSATMGAVSTDPDVPAAPAAPAATAEPVEGAPAPEPAKPVAPAPDTSPSALALRENETPRVRAGADEEETAAPAPAKQEETAAKPDEPQGGANPFMPGEPEKKPAAPAAPTQAAPAVKAEKKPLWVRGKECDLFPAGKNSVIGDYVSPAADVGQQNVKMKQSQYEGWNWQSNNLTGFSVKDGVMSMSAPGSLELQGFDAKEYNLSFEVKLNNAATAMAFQFGAAQDLINLMAVDNGMVVAGSWKPMETKNNVNFDQGSAKRHGGKSGWIAVQVAVRLAQLQVFVDGKDIGGIKPVSTTQFGRLGFLMLTRQGANGGGLSVRNVKLFVP
ncbi:MAG: hypothetical protein M5U26_20690 [Planctomycetota bacterium]|nr:hypothetical protein [Planctomycetota bacterium]